MRFKIFLSHFLVIAAVIIFAGLAGYFNLQYIYTNQTRENLHRKADFFSLYLNNPNNKDRIQEYIDLYGTSDNINTYACIIDSRGLIVAYPRQLEKLNPYHRQRDLREVTGKAAQMDTPVFEVGTGQERRMVYSQSLIDGNILVVSASLIDADRGIAVFKMYAFYTGLLLLFASGIILYFVSGIVMRPVYLLQEYSRNILVGEYIERADSLEEFDMVVVASVLEKLYNLTRKERFNDENPLSGLPGNKSLYDALFRRIESQTELAVGFVDANNFTAFSNRYGVDRAGSFMRFMGVIILNAITELGNSSDKVYHLGKDRFIFLTSHDKVRNICEKIIRDFDNQVVYFYDEDDKQKGYIISTDKNGRTDKFPYMPICIGVATNMQRPLVHPVQIGHIIGEIRNYLRERSRSSYLIDRRTTEREIEYTGKMAPFPAEDVEKVKIEIEELQRKSSVSPQLDMGEQTESGKSEHDKLELNKTEVSEITDEKSEEMQRETYMFMESTKAREDIKKLSSDIPPPHASHDKDIKQDELKTHTCAAQETGNTGETSNQSVELMAVSPADKPKLEQLASLSGNPGEEIRIETRTDEAVQAGSPRGFTPEPLRQEQKLQSDTGNSNVNKEKSTGLDKG